MAAAAEMLRGTEISHSAPGAKLPDVKPITDVPLSVPPHVLVAAPMSAVVPANIAPTSSVKLISVAVAVDSAALLIAKITLTVPPGTTVLLNALTKFIFKPPPTVIDPVVRPPVTGSLPTVAAIASETFVNVPPGASGRRFMVHVSVQLAPGASSPLDMLSEAGVASEGAGGLEEVMNVKVLEAPHAPPKGVLLAEVMGKPPLNDVA